MAHVQNSESDALRDKLLEQIYDVAAEDTRLAWLRKEQLQVIELVGLLRKVVPSGTTMAEDLHALPLSDETKAQILRPFQRADASATGEIELESLKKAFQRLDPTFTDDML